MNTVRKIALGCFALALFGFALPTLAGDGIPHALGLRMARPSPGMMMAGDSLPPVGRVSGGGTPIFSLAPSMPTPMDQGSIGSCGSCSTGYAWKSHMEAVARGWSPSGGAHTFSPSYLYPQVNGGGDNGSYFEDNLFVLCSRGVSTISAQPYVENVTTWPTQSQYENAMPQRNAYVKGGAIGSVVALGTPAAVKKAKALIAKGTPLLLGISVDNAFDNLDSGATNYVWYPNASSIRGGHAIPLIGYDDTITDGDGHVGAFEFQNSWGTGWCNGGRAYIAYDAFYEGLCVNQYAYYGAERKAYTPTIKANITINHPKRGVVFVVIGSGLGSKAKWSEVYYGGLVMNEAGVWDDTHANISATLDITGGAKCWPPSTKNAWWMMAWDYDSDGVTGSIAQFQLVGPGGTYTATVPVGMADVGPTYITLGGTGVPSVMGLCNTCDEAAE